MRARVSQWIEVFGWCLTASVLGVIGWWVITTGFMPYDDEGYVQWSLRQVAAGHPLYTEVFSQYGPFFHTMHWLLGKLGYPFTSDAARVMAMIYWLGTALGAGWLTRRLTKSAWLGISGFALTFMAMTQMRFEPGHPGGMLAMLSALSACAGVHWIERNRLGAYGRWQAVIAACMVWTKINVGVLQLIAIVSWWPFAAPRSVGKGMRRLLRVALVVLGAGALVASLLQHREVQVFLLFFVCAGGALVWTWPRDPGSDEPAAPVIGSAALAFLAVTIAACGPVLAAGTSLGDLLVGTILRPIRHPGVYHYLVPWKQADLWLIGLSAVGVIMFKLGPVGWRQHVLRSAKALALVLLAESVLRAHFGDIERTMFLRLPLLAWALATPPEDADQSLRQARHWLAWLLCWSWLQAFPVAGTQYVWGSFLAIPLALVGAQDLTRGRWRGWFSAAVCGLTIHALFNVGYYARQNWEKTVPLELPGARSTRLFEPMASTYRLLVENSRAGGDVLFSFPGMLSFNQWSGLPTPTHANATHWFSLLGDKQQRDIIETLRTAPNPVIIVCRSQIRYLIDQGLAPQGPLKEFIFSAFEPALRIGDYDIWKPRGSVFTPVSSARFTPVQDTAAATTLILLTDSPQATRLEMVHPQNPAVVLASADSDRGWRQTLLPAHLQPPHASAPVWQIMVPLDPSAAAITAGANIEFILRDEAGRGLDRLRLDRAPRPADAFSVSLPQSAD